MKPVFENGKLTVELHVPDKRALEKARDIGRALEALHQESGVALVAAITAILPPETTEN